jgi:hypothetical protein
MAVITETARTQSATPAAIGTIKLNGTNGTARPAEKESKLVDPFNYVVSLLELVA